MSGAEPKVLIIETSGRIGQIAVAHGQKMLGRRSLDETRRHARDLAPAVRCLLEEASWQPGDVNAVLVSSGPGSYTGLRVGIMSAKTFAYATGCVLLTVPTFLALAMQAPIEAVLVDVIEDAQQDKVYHQQFSRGSSHDEWRPASALSIQPLKEWLADLPRDGWVTGPGASVYARHLGASIRVVDEASRQATPESLLRLGLVRFQAGERDDQWVVEPLYLRPSAAEEKRAALVGPNTAQSDH
jgi:tRNA threonylcarbamoyladenosine biosynthesis protein TsaB